jgi:hypothetical protein
MSSETDSNPCNCPNPEPVEREGQIICDKCNGKNPKGKQKKVKNDILPYPKG